MLTVTEVDSRGFKETYLARNVVFRPQEATGEEHDNICVILENGDGRVVPNFYPMTVYVANDLGVTVQTYRLKKS